MNILRGLFLHVLTLTRAREHYLLSTWIENMRLVMVTRSCCIDRDGAELLGGDMVWSMLCGRWSEPRTLVSS